MPVSHKISQQSTNLTAKRWIPVLLMALGGFAPAAEFSGGDIGFFRTEVRPLLEEHCLRCHGGEDRNGKVKVRSGLQLISRKGIVLGGEHGPAFDEADPARSLLLHVLSYEDEDLKMPPKGKLEPEVVAVFEEWVKRGLPWTPEDADRLVEVEEEHGEITEVNETTRNHWSYRPMVRPTVPPVDDPDWAGAIDAFIYDGAREVGLVPNPEASRGELIRRVCFGLTGLPPTLEEVRAFEQDGSPDAWEKVVDRLLASPAYGEKWGRHWLDVVRYAETNGFERDSDKPEVWRYRDYVIAAFNSDKPYNQFLREQLAGDEIAEPTLESMTATGFHRLMQWDDEPADRKQHYYDVLDDDVRTTAEGMLAMTMGCARCHDHKGDPMSQEDYYSFLAFFRGVTPMGKGRAVVERIELDEPGPQYHDAVGRHQAQGRRLEQELQEVEARLEQLVVERRPELAGRLHETAAKETTLVADGRTRKPTTWFYTTERPETGWSEVGFRAEQAGWKSGPGGFGGSVPNHRVRTKWDTGEIWLQTSFGLEEIPKQLRVSLYHDEDVELFLNGQPVLARRGVAKNYLELVADEKFRGVLQTGRNTLAAHVRHGVGGQDFDCGLTGVAIDTLSLDEAVELHGIDKAGRELMKKRQGIRNAITKHGKSEPKPGVEVLTVSETGGSDPTYVHIRGNANAEDESREVRPRVPEIFGGEETEIRIPENGRRSSGRRSALAAWICRDDNPRTARVMMNRVWQHHFGRGICPTPNDFGFLGEAPTHSELLDWLATELVAQDWSLKAMHRQILLSRAYRMSSRGTAEGLESDPANRRFWRFNLRRLTAEEVRDSILAVAGTLNRGMGGPSVFVPLPPEVLATSSKKGGAWGRSSPEDEVRRSVYVKVKRSLVPPRFADLDAADTDASCPVRFTTIVPTQALSFLNSRFMNDQAKVLAERLRREAGPDQQDRVRLGLELALVRPASPSEIETGLGFLAAMRERHGLDEAAALERYALLVLNLNEFIFID